jgi:hypothetical protein
MSNTENSSGWLWVGNRRIPLQAGFLTGELSCNATVFPGDPSDESSAPTNGVEGYGGKPPAAAAFAYSKDWLVTDLHRLSSFHQLHAPAGACIPDMTEKSKCLPILFAKAWKPAGGKDAFRWLKRLKIYISS